MLLRAVEFAEAAHRGQLRKYTGEPYIVHPLAVARMVREVSPSDVDMQCAALLHDVVEDCGVTVSALAAHFNTYIALLVDGLTDKHTVSACPDTNRAERKRRERERLAGESWTVRFIKTADILHNAVSIKEHDKKFWPVFEAEAVDLIAAMKTMTSERVHVLLGNSASW